VGESQILQYPVKFWAVLVCRFLATVLRPGEAWVFGLCYLVAERSPDSVGSISMDYCGNVTTATIGGDNSD
jgi:hypothetical protein